MEEAPENGKESSHSAYANGMNECIITQLNTRIQIKSFKGNKHIRYCE